MVWAALAVAGPARAEAPPSQELSPVEVVAGRRDASLQTLPVTVQTFDRAELDRAQAHSLEDLGRLVPGLQWTTVGSFPLIFFRGLGSSYPVPFADPDVAVYVDGVYMPMVMGAFGNLDIFTNVDVYRGPQGSVFGRQSTAGAILLATPEPGRRARFSAAATAGGFGQYGARVALDGPVTEALSVGLTSAYFQRQPIVEDTAYTAAHDRSKALQLKLRYQSDGLSLTLAGLGGWNAGPGHLITNNTQPSLLGRALGITPQPDEPVSSSDAIASSRSRQLVAHGDLAWDAPWFDARLIGSVQRLDTPDSATDYDGSPRPLAILGTRNNFARLQSAELRLSSRPDPDPDAAGGIEWVVGLYHLHGLAGADPGYVRLLPGLFAGLQAGASSSAGTALGQALQPILGAAARLGTAAVGDQGLEVLFHGVLATDNDSIYGNLALPLSAGLTLEAGVRGQTERRALITSTTDIVTPLGGSVSPPSGARLPRTRSGNVAPRVGLTFKPQSGLLLYGSWAVGYKSATANIVNVLSPPKVIPTERVAALEFGSKIALPGAGGWLNLSLYDDRIHNLQSGFVSLASAGGVDFYSAAQARSRGGEIAWQTTAGSPSNPLVLNANAAYVDAHYSQLHDAPGFASGTGLYSSNFELSGNRIVYSPRWTGSIGVAQRLRVARGWIEVGVNDYLNSGYFTDATNTTREAGFALLGARAGYRAEAPDLSVSLSVVNLLDRRYHAVNVRTDFGVGEALAAGRQWVAQLSWAW